MVNAECSARAPASQLNLQLLEYASNINSYNSLLDHKEKTGRCNDTIWPTPLHTAHLLFDYADAVVKWSFLAGDWRTCTEWVEKAGESLDYYLFGGWRNEEKTDAGTIEPDHWFGDAPAWSWTLRLECGLAWCAMGGRWDLVDRLLTFPQPRIAPDLEGKVARGYYLGLARWWKDENDLSWTDEVKGLRGAGSKAYHLLCDVVAAISANDVAALEKSLIAYVQQFLKRRDHEHQFPLNATFLWHVARRKGLNPKLPEEIDMYIFRLPEKF